MRSMRVTLIHNTDAGDGDHSPKALRQAIEAAGHTVRDQGKADNDFPSLLSAPCDLVAAAGGDGTVSDVLQHMPDRGTPLAIIPLGTANNIARAFGIAGDASEQAKQWAAFEPRPLDLGVAAGPWGRVILVESVGFGCIAEAMKREPGENPKRENRIAAARLRIAEQLAKTPARECAVRIDGEETPGPFLFFEALNTPYMGPGLNLGCDADVADGMLDCLWAGEEQREDLLRWLQDPDACPPPMQRRRGRRVELLWTGGVLRRGDAFPAQPDHEAKVIAELTGETAYILAPGHNEAGHVAIGCAAAGD